MQTAVIFFEFFHDEQMPNSEKQSTILQESVSTQRNDLQYDIYNNHNVQYFSNKDIFNRVISDSYFFLYHDIFNDSNFSPSWY